MTILIPDTSALINIQDVYVMAYHITDVLDKIFDIKISSEVSREFRYLRSAGSEERRIRQFISRNKRPFYREKHYESTLRSHLMPGSAPSRNSGERYNCCLALYEVRRRVTGCAILLCDDGKATRGLIRLFEEYSRAATSWTSLDLLINIYLVTYPRWSLKQARGAMRTVNARIGGISSEAIKRLSQYNKRLEKLDMLLADLPGVQTTNIL